MFGKIGRFSIGRLMAIVSMVAIDCGLLRASYGKGFYFPLFLMTLPMLNIMILQMTKLRRGDTGRTFWIGFDLIGFTFVGVLCFLCWFDDEALLYPVLWLFSRGWLSENSAANLAITCGVVAVLYTTPQLLTAWLFGWLNQRYRVVIERRPNPVDSVGPASVINS
jgi:hypothetical protein